MVTEVTPESEEQARHRPPPRPVRPFPDLSTSQGRNIIFLNMLPGSSSQSVHLILRFKIQGNKNTVLRNTSHANSSETLIETWSWSCLTKCFRIRIVSTRSREVYMIEFSVFGVKISVYFVIQNTVRNF